MVGSSKLQIGLHRSIETGSQGVAQRGACVVGTSRPHRAFIDLMVRTNPHWRRSTFDDDDGYAASQRQLDAVR